MCRGIAWLSLLSAAVRLRLHYRLSLRGRGGFAVSIARRLGLGVPRSFSRRVRIRPHTLYFLVSVFPQYHLVLLQRVRILWHNGGPYFCYPRDDCYRLARIQLGRWQFHMQLNRLLWILGIRERNALLVIVESVSAALGEIG